HARRAHGSHRGRIRLRVPHHLPHAFDDQRPVAFGVEDLRARNARELRVRPLPLRDADLPAVDREEDGAAAAGAGVEREQEVVAHTFTAARLTTLTSRSPASNRSISAATIVTPRSSVSWVAPPMCGVMTTFR